MQNNITKKLMRKDAKKTLEKIYEVVSQRTGLDFKTNNSCKTPYIDAKKIYVLLAIRLTRYSYHYIGEIINRDRTNVYNLYYRGLELFETDPLFKSDYMYCLSELKDIMDVDYLLLLSKWHEKELAEIKNLSKFK